MSFNIRALKEKLSPNVLRNTTLVAGGVALPVAGYASIKHLKTPEQTIDVVKQSVAKVAPVAKAAPKKEADTSDQENLINHRDVLTKSKNSLEKSLSSAEQDFENAKGNDYLTKIAVDKHTSNADVITKLNAKIDKLSSGITENSFIESINKAREMKTNIIEENAKRNLGIGIGLGALGTLGAGAAYKMSSPATQANVNAHLNDAKDYVADKAVAAKTYVQDTINSKDVIADLKAQNSALTKGLENHANHGAGVQDKLDSLQKIHDKSVNLNGYDDQIKTYDKALGDMGSRITNLPEGKSYDAIKGSLTKQIEDIASKKGNLMTANEKHKLISENPNAKVQIDEAPSAPSISEVFGESTIHSIIRNVTSRLGR